MSFSIKIVIRASALYLAIIISTVIAVLTGTLITIAYFYKSEYQKNLRFKNLLSNLQSATELVLTDSIQYADNQRIDLYGEETDSIIFDKRHWGVYDLAVIKSFRLNDTLKRAFLFGHNTRQDQAALYISDENRPISVSGETVIRGTAILPKAGIKRAYVEGKPYSGKELIYGNIQTSSKTLPAISPSIIENLTLNSNDYSDYPTAISTDHSFLLDEVKYYAGSELKDIRIKGNIVLFSDTVLNVLSTAKLDDVIIFAPAIVIEAGFEGRLQIFASDSIVTGKNVVFNYPSCLGIIKSENQYGAKQPQIILGINNKFNGILFSFEKERSTFQTMISLGKESLVLGEIFASGFVKIDKPATIHGKLSANRILIKTPSALYENYLIDVRIDRLRRNEYYLSSGMFNTSASRKILQWLN